MKLKKLVVLEIVVLILVVVSLVTFVEVTSYLGSSDNNRIGLYNEKEYAEGNVTVEPGETARVRFTYSSYEPAILVLELTCRSMEKPGYLIVRCNNRPLNPIWMGFANQTVSLNAVSVSGDDWVEPLSSMFGWNEVNFESDPPNGFQGLLDYRIKLRGTR